MPSRSWTFLTRSFLLARWFVLLSMLVGDGGRSPPAVTPCGQQVGALCDSVENDQNDRLSVLEAGFLESDRLSTELEEGALENDRPSTVLETSALRAVNVFLEMVSLNVRRAARQAGAGCRPLGRHARAERGVHLVVS